MSSRETDRADVLDVEALMEDLRRRVAEKKAQGLYGVDALMEASTEDAGEPFGLDELERLRELAVQRVDLEVAPSTKPVVGGAVSRLKRLLVRGTSQPVYGLSAQTTAFNGALLAYLAALAREVGALERQARAERTAAEDARAEAAALRAELTEALAVVEALRGDVATLADAALPARIARLERGAGPAPPAPGGDRGRSGARGARGPARVVVRGRPRAARGRRERLGARGAGRPGAAASRRIRSWPRRRRPRIAT